MEMPSVTKNWLKQNSYWQPLMGFLVKYCELYVCASGMKGY